VNNKANTITLDDSECSAAPHFVRDEPWEPDDYPRAPIEHVAAVDPCASAAFVKADKRAMGWLTAALILGVALTVFAWGVKLAFGK
jgi:hypothetical protein